MSHIEMTYDIEKCICINSKFSVEMKCDYKKYL